jgi:phenolic acid decarboxylase
MIKKDHDEIWYWYQKMEEYKTAGMAQKEYCDAYEIDYKKFCNMRYRIEYKRDTNPELYTKNVPLTRKYMKSGIAASKFAKENNIDVRLLSEMVTHLSYVDIIESMREAKESQAMKFVQVPQRIVQQEAEIVEKQNDLEIIIAKGVKVSISPNIDTMKVVKIIEFLKDL